MSSRDFPVRQGVHLFFPSHVTPSPDYEFPPSASVSRSRAIASSVEAWNLTGLPSARRRRMGARSQEDGLPAIETLRESIYPRSQRGAAWVSRSPFGDDAQENDHFNVEPFLDQQLATRPPTPPMEDNPSRLTSANAWLTIRASRRARTRPTSPSVLSSASDAEAPPGTSSFPLPRDASQHRIPASNGSNDAPYAVLDGASPAVRGVRASSSSAREELTEGMRTGDPFAATLSAATGAPYASHHEESEHMPNPWPSDFPINPVPLRSRRSMFNTLRRSRSSSSDTLLAPVDVLPDGEAHPMGSLPMVRRHSREPHDDPPRLTPPPTVSADARQPIVLPLPVQQTRGLNYPAPYHPHEGFRIGSTYSADIAYADLHAISVASAEAETTEDSGLVTGEVDCDGEIA